MSGIKQTYYIYKIQTPDYIDVRMTDSADKYYQLLSRFKSACGNEDDDLYNTDALKSMRNHGGWNPLFIRVLYTRETKTAAHKLFTHTRLEHKLRVVMSEDDAKTKVHQADMERYLTQLAEYNKEKQEYQKTYQHEYQKTYRNKHREEMIKKSNEKLKCNCGGCYTYSNKSNHVATQKHIKYLQQQQIVNTETI